MGSSEPFRPKSIRGDLDPRVYRVGSPSTGPRAEKEIQRANSQTPSKPQGGSPPIPPPVHRGPRVIGGEGRRENPKAAPREGVPGE
jgi:hypothetical protein